MLLAAKLWMLFSQAAANFSSRFQLYVGRFTAHARSVGNIQRGVGCIPSSIGINSSSCFAFILFIWIVLGVSKFFTPVACTASRANFAYLIRMHIAYYQSLMHKSLVTLLFRLNIPYLNAFFEIFNINKWRIVKQFPFLDMEYSHYECFLPYLISLELQI